MNLPMTPHDCDLRDFPWMPMDVQRVLTSETWVLGNDGERAAAFVLWAQSWREVPAASLPRDDRMLEHLSMSKQWRKVKAHALRNWIECSDGRLYHPVVATKALEAWIEKLLKRLAGASGNAKRWGVDTDIGTVSGQVVHAANLLRHLCPQSKTLQKKQVVAILTGSPADRTAVARRLPSTSPSDSIADSSIDYINNSPKESLTDTSPPPFLGTPSPSDFSSSPSDVPDIANGSLSDSSGESPSNRNRQRHRTKEKEKEGVPRAPAAHPPLRPETVPEQVWADWLALRRSKRAPVTQTVLDGAIAEAEKAGVPLEAFLRMWCFRGSQGLQADWLKPDDYRRAGVNPTSRHHGFGGKDYRQGVSPDGRF